MRTETTRSFRRHATATLLAAALAALVFGAQGCTRAKSGAPPKGANAGTGSGSGGAGAAGSGSTAKRPAALSRGRATLLVGQLTREGVRHCYGANKTNWLHKHWEVGFVWLRQGSGGDLGFAALKNQAVVVSGARAKRPATPMPAKRGMCPPMQMRSDWVVSMNGVRRRRFGVSRVTAFSAREVVAFDGLKMEKRGDSVKVTLTNTIGRALSNVVLRMHYEGCYGKPGHASRDFKIASLAPGKSASTTLPQYVGANKRGDHRAASLQITASGDKVIFDFDLSLHRARPAVDVKCRRPGSKR